MLAVMGQAPRVEASLKLIASQVASQPERNELGAGRSVVRVKNASNPQALSDLDEDGAPIPPIAQEDAADIQEQVPDGCFVFHRPLPPNAQE